MSTPYSGWGKPATGGTALRLPAIQSPNFVNGVSGWIIRQDGSAQFNSIVIPPGTSGNTIFTQATTPTAFKTGDLWVDTARGNSIFVWNGSSWVAYQFGTAAIASGSITAALIAANTITASQLAAGIVYAGIVDGTTITGSTLLINNSHGARILSVNKSTGTWLLYADLGSSSQGGLIASCAATSGTDEFGNAYKAYITAYGTSGDTSYVQITPGTPALVNVATGDTAEATPAQIRTEVIGSGATRYLSNDLRAAFVTGAPSGQAEIQLFSANAGLTIDPGLNLLVTNIAGTVTSLMHQTPAGFTFTGETTLTPQQMSAHPVIEQTDHTILTATAAANTAVTTAWPIPANDAQVGTVYRLKAGGYGNQGSTAETLKAQLTFMGVNVGSDTLASTFMPISTQFLWRFEGEVTVVTTGSSGTARASGEFKVWELNGPSTFTMIIGQHAAIPPAADSTVNTTTAQTMSLGLTWGSTTGAPTATGAWSTLARVGA